MPIEKHHTNEWLENMKGLTSLIIGLSTGALTLSVTFLKQMLDFRFPSWLLGICWVSLAISILWGVYLYRILLDVDIDEIIKNQIKATEDRDEISKVYLVQMVGFASGFFALTAGALCALSKYWFLIFVIAVGVSYLYYKYGRPITVTKEGS